MVLYRYQADGAGVDFVLFGFRAHVASQLARLPLLHSNGYAAAGDHSTCFTTSILILEPFMKYAV